MQDFFFSRGSEFFFQLWKRLQTGYIDLPPTQGHPSYKMVLIRPQPTQVLTGNPPGITEMLTTTFRILSLSEVSPHDGGQRSRRLLRPVKNAPTQPLENASLVQSQGTGQRVAACWWEHASKRTRQRSLQTQCCEVTPKQERVTKNRGSPHPTSFPFADTHFLRVHSSRSSTVFLPEKLQTLRHSSHLYRNFWELRSETCVWVINVHVSFGQVL